MPFKSISIFLLSFYCFGTIVLPGGDFSMLTDLSFMYDHCKSTEDKDMTPIDFITDHLLNTDGLFDKHDNGDDQKPHSPKQMQHHGPKINSLVANRLLKVNNFHVVNILQSEYSVNYFPSDFITKIFRPPID